MTTSARIALFAGFTALLFVSWGCQKSQPTANSDWVIQVSANPAIINPLKGDKSLITAAIFNSSGAPQSGIGVHFSSTAGLLNSKGSLLKTDSRGEVHDVLTLTPSNAGNAVTATVSVISGAAIGKVDVKTGPGNESPTAAITITPSTQAQVGTRVVLSGANSADTDGEIAQYDWTIVSTNPDPSRPNPYTRSTTAQAVEEMFENAQELDISLKVTDDGGATNTTSTTYKILDNLPPVANAGSPQTGRKGSGTTYTCSITLSGCASSDPNPNGMIVAWEYAWGDGSTPPLAQCEQSHTYLASGVYTVTLTVYDNGNGDGNANGQVNESGDPCLDLPPSSCPTRRFATATTTVTCPE